jgi:peptide/nickel transport system substrate-binding protein
MKFKASNSLFISILTLFFLCSIALTSCNTSSTSGPKIFKVGNSQDTNNLGYPATITLIAGTIPAAPALETLYRIDSEGKTFPYLVEKDAMDPTASTITLTLRKGIKFHDGTDFNADAVKWNLEQCIAARVGGMASIKSIDVIDANTVRINLNGWDNTFISALTQQAGIMISPTAGKTQGKDWCNSNPVGTGPFQFVSWVKDSKITYKKFDGYWQKGKPYVDGVEIYPIADPSVREFSFRKGEVDVAYQLNPQQAQSLEKDGFMVLRNRTGSGSMGLGPDAINPKSPWADLKVRQAAQYAIDTEAIAKNIYVGSAESVNQWCYKGHWGYNSSIAGYPYNPSKAKQLLTDAGYSNGFKTKITYYSGSQNAGDLYTAIQGYFKTVGIDAALEPVTINKWFEVALNGGTWDGLINISPVPNPDLAAALLLSNMGGGRYFSQMLFPSDSVQAIKNAVSAPDFNGKVKYTQEAMKLSIDKYCNQLVLVSVSDLGASQKYVKNSGFWVTKISAWWTPEEVKLEK